MKFSIRFSDQIVGTLVILALVILIFSIFMLGRTQRWFVKDAEFISYFNSAQGLSQNMALQFKGFSIGTIKKITLSDDDRVVVHFTIYEEYLQRVREGSLVEVQVSPIGLGNAFVFHPGFGERLLQEGDLIPSVNSIEAKELISSGVTSKPDASGDSISSILNQVNSLLDTINKTLEGNEEARKLPLGVIIGNVEKATFDAVEMTGSLSEKIAPLLKNVELITEVIADPSSTVSKILDGDGPLYTSLVSSLVSISEIIEDLNQTLDFVPAQLPQIGALISQVNVTIESVQKAITAVLNNPILKGGVPERSETGPGGASPRNESF